MLMVLVGKIDPVKRGLGLVGDCAYRKRLRAHSFEDGHAAEVVDGQDAAQGALGAPKGVG
jgi:hypothetical protein